MYQLVEHNAIMVPAARRLGAPSDDLAALQARADTEARGSRRFYSVDVIEVSTGAVVYTARGTE